MEKIFSDALISKLKTRVKGKISVHVIGDKLTVYIYDNTATNWKFTLFNLTDKLSAGLSSTHLSDIIVKQYRNYILKHYFR